MELKDTETIIRLPTVIRLTGLSRSSIYRKMDDGDFPSSVNLGARAIGWLLSEVLEWIRSRPRRR